VDKKNKIFGIDLQGESKNKVIKLILEDGTIIDLKDVCHCIIIKEENEKSNDSMSDFSLSYRITKKSDYCFLSNNAFLMASCLRLMDKEGVEFQEAFILHKKLIEDAMEKSNENAIQ
jgi:hypothetical protein